MSHTPGPWHRNIKPATKYPTIFASLNTHIAAVKTEGMSPEEVEANIDLLTAAPDMFETLEIIAATLPHIGGNGSSVYGLLAIANQALSKARGEA